jgi:allantoicase
MAHASIPSSSATSPGIVSFKSLPDLACSNVGGKVLSCTDDFFGQTPCERSRRRAASGSTERQQRVR